MKKAAIVILVFFVLVLASCSSKTQETSQGDLVQGNIVNVAISGFKFVPADVTIKVGDSVVWTNEDNAPHTVESSDGTLKSDELSNGDNYKFTFARAGKYSYICGIHPSMKGSVTVQ